MTKVYVGDVGTVLLLDTESDLSTATAVSIRAMDPSGAEVSWAGEVSGGTKVRYVTQAGNLGEIGQWKLQARVVLPTGEFLGEAATLTVHEKFT